ncbi:10333_t:CDS:1 [Cetraspora pellucida]|uniref:10333_t:CDS:1 n=1 Tax=Cetraspora pellucida TaxID=1433469 RepID=A0A9N9GEM6_9GLOM|nr:10333_t:CDS:1 [Cetraspora pellucida]
MSNIVNITSQNTNQNNVNKDEQIDIDVTSTEAFRACLDKIFYLNQDPMAIIVDQLYVEIIDLFNKGKNSIPEIIKNFLDTNCKSNYDVFKWLLFYHKDKPEYDCLLGIFFRWNIGTDGTKGNAFQHFQDAATKQNSLAKYLEGKCYEDGWNVKKKRTKAIACFTQASDDCAAAGYALGAYYYKKQKFYLAMKWLQKSADKGNVMALHLLGKCYQKGRGTNFNVSKGFGLFMQAAEGDSPEAQYEIGQCFEFGQGTTKDLGKALDWYKKSASNGIGCYTDLERTRAKIMKQI